MLIAFLSILLSPAIVLGDTEPNGDFDSAEQIVAGVHEGELDCFIWCDDEDYYKATLVAGQLIYVNVTSTPETSVFLYDEQQEISESSWTKNTHQIFWVTTSSAPPSFTYYIEIRRSSGEGPYTMEVSIVSQNDANSGGDAGDKFDSATLITAGIRYSGYTCLRDSDYYAIGIQEESRVVVDLWSNQEESASAWIYDGERHFLDLVSVQYGAHDNTSFDVSEPQTVYVLISTTGTYDFQITLEKIDDTTDTTDAFDVLSLLFSWLPYIIVILVLVLIVVAIVVVVKRR